MTIKELYELVQYGTQIKAESAFSGKLLVSNMAKKENREKYGELSVYSIYPSIYTNKGGGFARPIIVCSCDEDGFKTMKANKTQRNLP